MLQQILSLLPGRILGCSVGLAIGLAAIGAVLWLVGARFSRSLITLIAVAIGTLVGLHLPGWLGWSIDGMALAVGGAVVLGTSGYLLDRTWIGLWLGVILAAWSAAGAWMVLGRGNAWRWATIDAAGSLPAMIAKQREQLPSGVAAAMLLAASSGFALGVLLTVLRPRLSKVLVWSLGGLTLLIAMGGVAVQASQPQWIASLPAAIAPQVGALLCLVCVGAAVQWWQLQPKVFIEAGACI